MQASEAILINSFRCKTFNELNKAIAMGSKGSNNLPALAKEHPNDDIWLKVYALSINLVLQIKMPSACLSCWQNYDLRIVFYPLTTGANIRLISHATRIISYGQLFPWTLIHFLQNNRNLETVPICRFLGGTTQGWVNTNTPHHIHDHQLMHCHCLLCTRLTANTGHRRRPEATGNVGGPAVSMTLALEDDRGRVLGPRPGVMGGSMMRLPLATAWCTLDTMSPPPSHPAHCLTIYWHLSGQMRSRTASFLQINSRLNPTRMREIVPNKGNASSKKVIVSNTSFLLDRESHNVLCW